MTDGDATTLTLNAHQASSISHVSLYSGYAEVTRHFRIALKDGQNEILIQRLPLELLKDSVRVEGRGHAFINDVVISRTPREKGASTEQSSSESILKRRNKELEKELDSVKHAREGVDVHLDSLLKTSTEADFYKLEDMLSSHRGLARKLDRDILNLEAELRDISLNIKKLKASSLDSDILQRPWQVKVLIQAKISEEVEFYIKYVVGNADWYATYDIRADTQSQGDKAITIVYKASITQNTGESWDNVPLTLETSTPTYGLSAPPLWSWKIGEVIPQPPIPVNNQLGWDHNEGGLFIPPAPGPAQFTNRAEKFPGVVPVKHDNASILSGSTASWSEKHAKPAWRRAFVENGVETGGYGRIAVNLAQNYALKVGAHDTNPRSYREAIQSDHAEEWYKAMAEEMNNHKVNGTWTPVYLPAGARSIGSRWVFKVKHMTDGSIDRFKARVVAQGFSQRPGVDFEETFAPTARWAAVRTILAIAAIEDMHLESVDVTAAFLNSKADAELYLRLPDGADRTLPDGTTKRAGDGPIVGRLNKGMYGLKQGAYLWHKRMNEVFVSIGFVRIVSDPCVYCYLRDGVRVIIPVHVDDMTIASTNRPAILRIIDELRQHFKLRHLGPTVGLLGVRVTRDRTARKLWIDQRAYAIDLLARFGMLDCKPLTAPMDPSIKLSLAQCPTTDAERAEMAAIPYIQATGGLLYYALCTRPDLMKIVSLLCRFNSNPGMAHWTVLKRLLRFVRATLDYRIEYSAEAALPGPQMFRTYSDADHGGNPDNGKSTSGYLILVGGGAVDWSSKLQTVVSMSTTEAEFIAASEAGRALCSMRSLLDELGYTQKGPSELLMDNQSAISVSKHPEHMGRLKHLDRHFFWLRDAVYAGTIVPVFIPTTEMVADVLTKALPREVHDKFRRLMGIIGEWSSSPL